MGTLLLGRSEMSGKEPMEISVLPWNFSTCSSSWATPQLAPASSLGTRSLKKSLPFRSAWGMGYGEGEVEPGFLLVWLPCWLLESTKLNTEFCCSRAQPPQGWVSLSFVPTHEPPQCHGGFALDPASPASPVQCCGTPVAWTGCAIPRHAQLMGQGGLVPECT